ncbi:hypothetical protein IPM62_05710 [Candidatus Woesebacteria bacterium]|nr:MAG: hypothetical protein IPM62_05710 [Candidatus Woesebacteria bacterium]
MKNVNSYEMLKLFVKYFIYYLGYMILTPAIVIFAAFVVIIIINTTDEEVLELSHGFPVQIVKFFLQNILRDTVYDEKDILSVFAKMSFAIMIISRFMSYVYATLRKKYKLRYYLPQWTYKHRLMCIVALVIFTETSLFLPQAAAGAKTIWWVILFLGLIGILSYLFSAAINKMADLI